MTTKAANKLQAGDFVTHIQYGKCKVKKVYRNFNDEFIGIKLKPLEGMYEQFLRIKKGKNDFIEYSIRRFQKFVNREGA